MPSRLATLPQNAWTQALQHRLHCAVAANRPWRARVWLGLGADPNARVPPPAQWGWDPLLDVTHPMTEGWTMVHLAAAQGFSGVLRRLAHAGARLDEPAGPEGATPLMVAAWHGSFDVLDALIGLGAPSGAWTAANDPERFMRTRDPEILARWRGWRAEHDAEALDVGLPKAKDSGRRLRF